MDKLRPSLLHAGPAPVYLSEIWRTHRDVLNKIKSLRRLNSVRNFTSHRPQQTCGCRSYDPVWCSHVFLVQQTEIISSDFVEHASWNRVRLNLKHTLYIKAGHNYHDITNWLMTSCYGISSWLFHRPHFGVLNYLCFILIFLIILKLLITYLNRFFHICERFPKTKYNINKYKRLILLPKSDQTVTEKYWSNKTIQNHIGSQHLCSISTCFSSLPGLPETCTFFTGCSCLHDQTSELGQIVLHH